MTFQNQCIYKNGHPVLYVLIPLKLYGLVSPQRSLHGAKTYMSSWKAHVRQACFQIFTWAPSKYFTKSVTQDLNSRCAW